MALTPYEEAFLIKEHAALRSEVLKTLKEARDVERNVIAAIAFVVVWLGKDTVKGGHLGDSYWPLWWVPFSLVALGVARSIAILRLFGVLSEYLKQVEDAFLSAASIKGWEHFSEKRRSYISITGVILWIALAVATLAIGIFHP